MNIFALIDFVNIILAVFLGAVVFTKDPVNKLNRIFLINCLLAAYTAFCEYFRLISPNEDIANIWHHASMLWPFLPFYFMKFTLTFTGNRFNSDKVFNLISFLPALVISFLHLFTGIFYDGLIRYSYGWEFVKAKNPYSAFVPVYILAIGIFSLYEVTRFYIKQKNRKNNLRKQALYTIIGISIPFFAGIFIDALLPVMGLVSMPLTAAFFLVGSSFLFVSLYRYKSFLPDPLTTIKKVLNSTDDLVIIFNRDLEIQIFSRSFEYTCTYSSKDITGENLNKFILPITNSGFISLGNYTGVEKEANLKTAGGELIPVSIIISPIDEYDWGAEKLFLLIGRDLRERKRFENELLAMHKFLEDKVNTRTKELAYTNLGLQKEIIERLKFEDELRASEKRYRNLFENSPIGIYRTTPDGEIQLANPFIVKTLGYSSFEELSQVNLEKQGFHKDSPRQIFKTLLEKNDVLNGFESIWLKKDKTSLYCRENAVVIKDDADNILYYEGTIENITKQKITEKALQKSEERFRRIIETAHEGIMITNSDSIITFVNPKMHEMFGCQNEPMVGRSLEMFFFDEDLPEFLENMENLAHGKNETFERRFRRLDGKTLWTLISASPIFDENSCFQGSFAMIIDLTAHKAAEKSLREKEYWLKEAQKTAKVGYYYFDIKNDLWEASEILDDILGIDKSFSRNFQGWQQLIHPEHREMMLEFFEKIIKEKLHFETDYKIIRLNDKKELWVHGIADLDFDKSGNPIRMFGTILDITERKEAEEALRESEHRLKNLTEAAFEGIAFTREGIILDCNEQLARLFKTGREKLLGRKLMDFITPGSQKFADLMISTENPDPHELWAESSDKTIFPVEVINRSIGSNGKKYRISILRDISERKKSEEELNKYRLHLEDLIRERTIELAEVNKLLEEEIQKQKESEEKVKTALIKEQELNALKSRFISVASHEFRTPLTGILAAADLLELHGFELPKNKYLEYVGSIQKSVEYMNELIGDVLAANMSETAKSALNTAEIDLYELARGVLANIGIIAPDNIKFAFDYTLKERIFNLDHKLITQILTNLISNAVKYSPDGGNVTLSIFGTEGQINLCVKDEGIGIPGEDLEHLFEPFHRGQNVGQISGTGLGLSIARKSAEMHNGIISIESSLKKGTTVSASLPYMFK